MNKTNRITKVHKITPTLKISIRTNIRATIKATILLGIIPKAVAVAAATPKIREVGSTHRVA